MVKDGKPMFIQALSDQPEHRTSISSAKKLAA